MAVVLQSRPALFGRLRVAEPAFFPVVAAFFTLAVFGSRADPADRPGWVLGPGMTLVAVLGLLMTVLAVAAPDRSWTRRALDARPVVWVGTRSYGIYLIHGAMAAAVSSAVGHGGGMVAGASLVLTLVAAEASYRWVEQPLLRRVPVWARRTTPAIEAPAPVGAAAAGG